MTVSINGTETLTGVYTDPVNYSDTAENGLLVSASETLDSTKLTSKDAIVFTALYPYTTTKRAGDYIEYTVEYEDGKKEAEERLKNPTEQDLLKEIRDLLKENQETNKKAK